jgi:hypothetical protein
MYKASSHYVGGKKPGASGELTVGINGEYKKEGNKGDQVLTKTTGVDLSAMNNTLLKYFGHTDTYSIYVAACEQEDGAHKKPASGEKK